MGQSHIGYRSRQSPKPRVRRDEPLPKLRRAIKTLVLAFRGRLSSNSGLGFAVFQESPIEKEELAETGTLDSLEELLGDDLVRIDVRSVMAVTIPVSFVKDCIAKFLVFSVQEMRVATQGIRPCRSNREYHKLSFDGGGSSHGWDTKCVRHLCLVDLRSSVGC